MKMIMTVIIIVIVMAVLPEQEFLLLHHSNWPVHCPPALFKPWGFREVPEKWKVFVWENFPKSLNPPIRPRVFVRFGNTKGEIQGHLVFFWAGLGISHPTHPYLGKSSQKKLFYFLGASLIQKEKYGDDVNEEDFFKSCTGFPTSSPVYHDDDDDYDDFLHPLLSPKLLH